MKSYLNKININKIKIELSDKFKLILKICFISLIIIFVAKEFANVIKSFNLHTFVKYKNKLTFVNLIIIGILGIVSYIPLSFYDFLLKRKVGINLKNTILYKYSWIASSLSSLLGFGGASALAFKQYFYREHVEDKKLLIKEIGKIVALNLTGLSLVCSAYIFLKFSEISSLGIIKYPIIVITLYAPLVILFSVCKYFRNKDKSELGFTLGIIGISFSEWLTTILLIYATLKITGANVSVYSFLPIYIEAAVVGIISMIPGGIGTFDLTFIAGLETLGVPVEQAFLVILLYRISYYIVPATIGILLYANDFGKAINKRFNGLPKEILSNIAYKGLIVLVFLCGIVIILSGIAPEELFKIKFIKSLIEKRAIVFSLGINVILGFLLILSSFMLRYKSKKTYKITIALLIISIIVPFIAGIKFHRIVFISLRDIIFISVVAYIVYLSKDKFYRENFVLRWKYIFMDLCTFGLSFGIYFTILNTYSRRTVHRIAHYIPYKVAYKVGILSFIIITILYVTMYFISKKRRIPVTSFDSCKDDVEHILENYKGTPLTHLVFLRDKYIYLNKDKDVMFQYEIFEDKLFVLGNPIGNSEKLFKEIESFCDFADLYGYIPIFYQVDESMIEYLHSNGYNFMKLGEEAKVYVQDFKVVGNKMKSLKSSRNKITKEGYSFEILKPPFSKELMKNLREISNEWLDNRNEKGFSVGYFDEGYLQRAPIAVVKDAEGEIKGFANIMPMYDDNKSFSIDLMRFTQNAPRGLMDYMFINLIETAKEDGYEVFNMGVAPLSNVGVSKYAFSFERLALQMYEYGQAVYSFRGLRSFKEKFTNVWECKYIAYRRETSLLITVIQAAMLCSRSKTKSSIVQEVKEVVMK